MSSSRLLESLVSKLSERHFVDITFLDGTSRRIEMAHQSAFLFEPMLTFILPRDGYVMINKDTVQTLEFTREQRVTRNEH